MLRGALLLLIVGLPACVVPVWPPAAPLAPVQVYVYTDDWHQGLILPHPAGGFVEFSFGESDWFAYDETSRLRLPEVLLHGSAATLARRRIAGRAPDCLDAAYPFPPRFALAVPGAAVAALREDLERRFAAAPGRVYFDPVLQRQQLREPRREYWAGYNCCDALREWLQRLECRVGWAPIIRRLEPGRS